MHHYCYVFQNVSSMKKLVWPISQDPQFKLNNDITSSSQVLHSVSASARRWCLMQADVPFYGMTLPAKQDS